MVSLKGYFACAKMDNCGDPARVAYAVSGAGTSC